MLKLAPILRVDHFHHIDSNLFKGFPSGTRLWTLVALTFPFWETPVFVPPKLLHQQHLVQAGVEEDHPTCWLTPFPFSKLDENLLQRTQMEAETGDPWEDLCAELFERIILLRVWVSTVAEFKLLLCCEAVVEVVPLQKIHFYASITILLTSKHFEAWYRLPPSRCPKPRTSSVPAVASPSPEV